MDSEKIIYEDCMKRLIQLINIKYALNKQLNECNKLAKEQIIILNSLNKLKEVQIKIKDLFALV